MLADGQYAIDLDEMDGSPRLHRVQLLGSLLQVAAEAVPLCLQLRDPLVCLRRHRLCGRRCLLGGGCRALRTRLRCLRAGLRLSRSCYGGLCAGGFDGSCLGGCSEFGCSLCDTPTARLLRCGSTKAPLASSGAP